MQVERNRKQLAVSLTSGGRVSNAGKLPDGGITTGNGS